MSSKGNFLEQDASQSGLLPVFDPQGLTALTSVLSEDQVVKLIGVCLVDAQERTDLIIHAASTQNWHEVGNCAHDVKSTAGQIGAARLQDLAARLEANCRDDGGRKGNSSRSPELVAAFKEAAQLTLETYAVDRLPEIIALAKALEAQD